MRVIGLLAACCVVWCAEGFWAGVGRADVTGPVSDVNLMGYAQPSQVGGGLHSRLWARAFVLGAEDGNGSKMAFVSVDVGMGSYAVTKAVVDRLQEKFPGEYTQENVCISGTHTHSAPAGFLQNVLFQITSLGLVHETFDSLVSGIVLAVSRAHEDGKPGRELKVARGEMAYNYASINRSPTSYEENPASERALYSHNTDLNMTVLRIEEADGTPVGMVNWFAVHGTSLPSSNTLISGDNKGYASQMFEHLFTESDVPTGKSSFVAAFASTNLGDVSPNVNGTFCTDTGLSCEELHSTCHGKNEYCVGRGPSWDAFSSSAIIGKRQVDLALELFSGASSVQRRRHIDRVAVRANVTGGDVDVIHVFRDFGNLEVKRDGGSTVKTCKPSMGYAFAAGTTDGPGAFDFFQGETSPNPIWRALVGFLKAPSEELQECQHPKPVLLATGEIDRPYPWDPSVLPLQIMRIGRQLAILSVPAEFTTMAGRRLRSAVRKVLVRGGALEEDTGLVVIAGLANEYSSYVTTFEEYQVQRYEAASTLYGPHTLEAYIQEFKRMAESMVGPQEARAKLDPGPTPPDLMSNQISLLLNTLPDRLAFGASFGGIVKDVNAWYHLGTAPGAVISATFHGANPRNNMRLEETYLEVQWLKPNQTGGVKWTVFSTDTDFDTRFIWEKGFLGASEVRIEWRPWESQRQVLPGTYRLVYYGDRKHLDSSISAFVGSSSTFELLEQPTQSWFM
mmetsp:Transcript_21636/g.40439  ORF Transcript_21636/g.40439 Transcript_21636/m.40439 type:complete len:734 (-) Transcript_21636:117-2318(-)